MTLVCKNANWKIVDVASVVNVAIDEERIIDSLVENLKFGQGINAEFFGTFFKLKFGAQGLVKILKLKFGQYFEADAYLRFDNIWKYN